MPLQPTSVLACLITPGLFPRLQPPPCLPFAALPCPSGKRLVTPSLPILISPCRNYPHLSDHHHACLAKPAFNSAPFPRCSPSETASPRHPGLPVFRPPILPRCEDGPRLAAPLSRSTRRVQSVAVSVRELASFFPALPPHTHPVTSLPDLTVPQRPAHLRAPSSRACLACLSRSFRAARHLRPSNLTASIVMSPAYST